MKRTTLPPAVTQTPTITSGEEPPVEIQARMVSNQVRSARDWNDTAQDLVINNIINENQDVRDSRRELLILACLVLVLLVAGSIYTYRTYASDQFIAQERAQGTETPYRPETVR